MARDSLYNDIFSALPFAAEYYDCNGIIAEINTAAIRLFCINPSQDEKQFHYSLFTHPFLKGLIQPNIVNNVALTVKVDSENIDFSGYPYSIKGCYYFEVNITILSNNEGYLVTYKDMSEYKYQQALMHERFQKIHFAMRAADIVFWEVDTKTHLIKSFNDPLNGRKEPLVMPLEELLQYVHPNDRERALNIINKSISSGFDDVISVDFRMKYSSCDQWHYCTVSTRYLNKNAQGKITKYVGVRKDNTKLITANKELEAYIEKMDYMLKECSIQSWNFDFESQTLSIYSDSNKLYDKMPLQEYFNRLEEPDRSEVVNLFANMPSGKAGVFSNFRKLTYTSKNIGTRYVIFNGMPVRDSDGKIVSYFGLRRDITDIMITQEKLEKETQKAKQSDRLKSAFLANISHEIRTPLNAIVGFSNLLETTQDEETRKEFVEIINHSNELLLDIIHNILDLSKIESGIVDIENEEFDMSQCFTNTIMALLQNKTLQQVEFKQQNPYKECIVIADKNRIAQLIKNFCTNAIKYTNKGYIKAGYVYTDGGIKIYVEDTGKGIAKEQQHLIFNSFEKIGSFVQGSGLGLTICKTITDACNGKIGFTSQEGKGSVFWAWIPCQLIYCEPCDENLDTVSGTDFSIEQEIEVQKSIDEKEKLDILDLKVLVADDNNSNFLLVKSYLIGHHLEHACNGKEAVEMISKRRYDIVLMDLEMPIMDGVTAIKKIREFNKDIPIITITAYACNYDKQAAISAGSTAFLTKPFSEYNLKSTILNCMNIK